LARLLKSLAIFALLVPALTVAGELRFDDQTLATRSKPGMAYGESGKTFVSPDGNYAAFTSTRLGLVADDFASSPDTFVRSLISGRIFRVNQGADGKRNGAVANSTIRLGDAGKWAAYSSGIDNYAPTATSELYYRDLTKTAVEKIPAIDSRIGDTGRYFRDTSVNGSRLLFRARAKYNLRDQLYVVERLTGVVRGISYRQSGGPSTGVDEGILSPDGRFAVFASTDPNMVTGFPLTYPRLYIRDIPYGVIRQIPLPATAQSSLRPIRFEGNQLTIETDAPLIWNDTNGASDLYRLNTDGTNIIRISEDQYGNPVPIDRANSDAIQDRLFAMNAYLNRGTGQYAEMPYRSISPKFANNNPDVVGATLQYESSNSTAHAGVFLAKQNLWKPLDTEGFGAIDSLQGDVSYAISEDGQTLTYLAQSVTVESGNGSGRMAVYRFDRRTQQTTRLHTDEAKYIQFLASGGVYAIQNVNRVLYRFNIETGERVELPISWYGEPCELSGDGKFLIFSSYRRYLPVDKDGSNDVYLYNLTSMQFQILSRDANGARVTDYWSDFELSENNQVAAFSGETQDALKIFRLDLSVSNVPQNWTGPIVINQRAAQVSDIALSKTGNRLAYRAFRSYGNFLDPIYTIKFGQKTPTKLTDQGSRPTISPDGNYVAYIDNGNLTLTSPGQRSYVGELAKSAVFSGDGRSLAVSYGERSNLPIQIYVGRPRIAGLP